MDKQWKAKWIMDPRFNGLIPTNIFHKELEASHIPTHREDFKNVHMLVRKEFYIDKCSDSAVLDITADDYYKLYINGQFVGQGPAPGYYFHYYYNRYDVSEFLVPGENVIAVHVYYQGLVNRVWNSGDYRQGMIAELKVDNKLVLASDSSWKYTLSSAYQSGGLAGYETQYLENIDSRLEEKGWREAGYDDSHWQNPWGNITNDHKLFMQETPPVEVYEIKPREVKKIASGHYIIDFGHEITGQFKMKAQGDRGQVLEIRCGEELENEETVRYQMRCNCDYQEFWTLSGNGMDTLEFFDYKAFRYVEILGPAGVMDVDTFSAVVRHYPMEEPKCTFISSDKLLNQIWDICKNGVKYGSQEAYLDCPSREKGQYLGDATVTALSQMYLSGDLRLFKKQIKDFALSSFICPGLMAVAPGSFMQEIADFSMQWPMQLLTYYKHSGDLELLREMFPVCQKLVQYFKQYEREDGLLEEVTEKWNLVDWPNNLRDGYDFELKNPIGEGCHNVLNAFYCGMIKTVNEIMDILEIPYIDTFPKLKQSFIKAFYDQKRKFFVDAQDSKHAALHSNVLPLLFDLIPEEVRDRVVTLIKEKKFSCGVYMGYFVLKALAKAGEYETVYDFITMDDEHSWANMIKEGATTCFEAWGKEQKWNTSLCHPWASAPISVLIEDIIGLSPKTPGWKEIECAPHIPENVEYIMFEFHIKTGRIKLEYKDGELFTEGI